VAIQPDGDPSDIGYRDIVALASFYNPDEAHRQFGSPAQLRARHLFLFPELPHQNAKARGTIDFGSFWLAFLSAA
jgi:hypothetical protein